MSGYLAMTDSRWTGLLQSSKATDGINFWSPCDKPLRNDLMGSQIYFYAEPPGIKGSQVVGFGTVGDVYVSVVSDAWNKFEDRNGAKKLSIFLKLLNDDRLTVPDSRPILESSLITCHTLDDVRWLPEPVDLGDIGITIRKGIQRGRLLTSNEEARLHRTCVERIKERGDKNTEKLESLESLRKNCEQNLRVCPIPDKWNALILPEKKANRLWF
jgi:hypothetical protein